MFKRPVLERPRWPGGPHICEKANLPAFESEKSLYAFRDKNAMHEAVITWECKHCGHWHFKKSK